MDYVDKKFVKKLKKTKCESIFFGFESGSNRILNEVVNKGISRDDIVGVVKNFKWTGILCSGSFIFGMPSETEEEFKTTMRFIVELLEIYPKMAFTVGWFLPYPGTELYEEACRRGFNPPKKIGDWDKFDRWSEEYKMDWIEWDYKKMVKYSRKTVRLLALSYELGIPFIKHILKWRIKNVNYFFPLDIYLLSKIIELYGNKKRTDIITKILQMFIDKIISR